MFFATPHGKNTDSALPLLNILDLLTAENIFLFRLLQFSHQWHKKQLPSIFITTFIMLGMFTHTTPDMIQKATSIKHASGLTLKNNVVGSGSWPLPKTTTWHYKGLNLSILPKKAKQYMYLLRKQMWHLSPYNSSILDFSQMRECVCCVCMLMSIF